jgi:halimadienyl-diphosphate synthase
VTFTREMISLVSSVVEEPLRGVDAATYDTASLVWEAARRPDRFPQELVGAARKALLDSAQPDGTWGPTGSPPAFHRVPTLAAVGALLTRPDDREASHAALRGLRHVADNRADFAPDQQPDTAAVEYLFPALLERISASLPDAATEVRPAIDQALAACGGDRLRRLRAAVRDGRPLPVHISHSLEILESGPQHLAGLVSHLPAGCSAAATAAFAARSPRPRPDAVALLRRQSAALAGALPVICHMDTFELLWAMAPAVRLGLKIPDAVRRNWLTLLKERIGSDGVQAGPGLPPDGDDTAVALYLAARLGGDIEPSSLLRFRGGQGVASYPGERTSSTTTTAHALEAIGVWATAHPRRAARYADMRTEAESWLLENQRPDGSWCDKWHISPLYAVSCVAPALHAYTDSLEAVDRAVAWVLETQRSDGSWGIWQPTAEETAFALHTLLLTGAESRRMHIRQAIARGVAFLEASTDKPFIPMWCGKQLYSVPRITRSYLLAALAHRVGQTRASRNR